MAPPKRPPPPSPLRSTAVTRSTAPMQSPPPSGSRLGLLLLWGGVAAGLCGLLLVVAVVLLVGWTQIPTDIAVTTPPADPSVAIGAPAQNPTTPVVEPAIIEPDATLPSEPAPAGLEPMPTAALTVPAPLPAEITAPPNPALPAPNTATTTAPETAIAKEPVSPPPPPMSGATLDDVRQRNGVLRLPERKLTEPVVLARIAAASPQQCELTILGGEVLCPPGFTLQLNREDPSADERIWHVGLKSAGTLSKEKVIADFRLQDGELRFQWQKIASGSTAPALAYCLLQIDAGGEQETCRLGKPLTAELLSLKVTDRWTIEAALPADLPSGVKIQAELQAVDFPNVISPEKPALRPGETAVYTISGASTGSLPVELELEVKLETKEGKLQLVVIPYAEAPAVGKADRKPGRNVVSVATLKRRKAELAKLSSGLETKLKNYDAQIRAWENEVTSLNATPAINANQRSAVIQRLALVRGWIAAGETERDEALAAKESYADAAAWFSDLSDLIDVLHSQAKVGLVLFHTVGQERVVVAAPQTQP